MNKILFVIFFCAASLYAQLSPGDLTNAHSKLEGLQNCTKCHNLGEQLTNNKCLDCHKEIKERIGQNKGFHSSIDVKGKNCWSCHSEHNGKNFEIVHFDRKKFDHTKTGFKLTGSHSKIDCGKCHKSDFIRDNELNKRKNTFLGLRSECSACHEDVHKQTLGNKCTSCHNTEKFIPAALFVHNKAKFKLTGAHIQTGCEKCHIKEIRNGKQFQKFTGLNIQLCTDCHKDVHTGKFGNDCTKCHNTASFKNIIKASFNHDKTNFKLIGKHENVECSKCHGKNLSSKPKHELCTDCHQDYHKGQFLTDTKIRDCKVCHSETGFSPALFTLENHNQLKFKLTGSHLATPCGSCHLKQNNWVFKNMNNNCIGCHKNIHGSEISSKFMVNNNCSLCHNSNSWTDVTFDHSKTKFILTGKHGSIECKECHLKENFGKKELLFNSLDTQCENCHKDVHNGQFKNGSITQCESCHNFDRWKPVKFDHNKTNFQLIGAHQNVACNKCHKEVVENNKRFIKYKIENFKCADCHS